VSEPEIASPGEAAEYLEELKQVLQYADISDCDMEKGSLRCDANLSLRPSGRTLLGVKTEIKNLNSFKSIEKALSYEALRQRKILERGEKVMQETRLWDEKEEVTRGMRSKEYAHDYRYFPEPDLIPIVVEQEWIEKIKSSIAEQPLEKRKRFLDTYKLTDYEADVLTSTKPLADFFERAVENRPEDFYKPAASWILNDLLGWLNEKKSGIEDLKIRPQDIGDLVGLIREEKISGKMAKEIFPEMLSKSRAPGDLVREKKIEQISDEGIIGKMCEEAILENPRVAEDYRSGKKAALGRLVGDVMKKSSGKAHPGRVNAILAGLLQKE
ncbi:MAG TPA: Asp-tRNA(Asn)/Glu-tRNA(Gln) amidotransferase subunit GatB, partial [bacterium]|nr:Asp-tRNA(Asn)/Glu-tRNA(Gln) amidotransferase subunit GatB [bacterium]